MAKRYPWWGYVRYMVRSYPEWLETPLGNVFSTQRKGFDAVQEAIDKTERMENGVARLKIIQMVHWNRTRTLEGAALSIPCGRATAARWQREFFEEVARNRGLMD